MMVSSFRIFRFNLALRQPLVIGGKPLTSREGFIVELGAGSAHVGLGEVSPLPGLSRESLEEAGAGLKMLRSAVLGEDIPDGLHHLTGAFENWLGQQSLVPSVKFGFETALLRLEAATEGLPLCRLICDPVRDSISVNGLLSGPPDGILFKAGELMERGYGAFKLKVGQQSIDQDAQLIREVRQVVGDAVLRLDANRAWSLDEAIDFSKEVEDCRIDYLEEPVKNIESLRSLASSPERVLPIALDETLQEIDMAGLLDLPGIKAVVLKPTLYGFERTARMARMAASRGTVPVISSAFESGVGLEALAQLATCVNRDDIPAGLDTLDVFEKDLLTDALKIEGGRMRVDRFAPMHWNTGMAGDPM